MTNDNPGAWQLGHTDGIPKQDLSSSAEDTDLEVVLTGADTSKVVVGLLNRLPTDRWRLVRDVSVSHGRATRKELWIAPADADTWWVLTATHVAGLRHILVDPETHTPLPSRADRRSGLVLDWVSNAVTVVESEVTGHEFEFVLRNARETDWVNVGNDTKVVTVVPSAEPRFYIDDGRDHPLPTLPPGGATIISARLSEPLSAGTYQASAVLVDLNLTTSATATLTVVTH